MSEYQAEVQTRGFDGRRARERELAERILTTDPGTLNLRSSSLDAPIGDQARIRIAAAPDIIAARQQSRAIASLVGFSNSQLTMIATAVSEVARNIVEYANEGEVTITLLTEGTRTGVKIVVSDEGPGIADITAAMRDGFSTGQRLGIGLPGAKRLMDEFDIASEVGRGTTIVMKKWL